MSIKRKDNKGRTLRNGERRAVYSRKLAETGKRMCGQYGVRDLNGK